MSKLTKKNDTDLFLDNVEWVMEEYVSRRNKQMQAITEQLQKHELRIEMLEGILTRQENLSRENENLLKKGC